VAADPGWTRRSSASGHSNGETGTFLITGAGGNTTLRVTNAGLIVVDGKLPGDTNYDALMALIKGVSNQPVKYLIVTHTTWITAATTRSSSTRA